jgi:phage replication O-like protein O
MSTVRSTKGFTPPNYTQTPNCLFSHWIKVLKEVELKVLLIIMRKTFGWHKEKDRISLSQLSSLTGCSETNVLNAVRNLIKKGLIRKEVRGKRGKQKTYYEMIVSDVSEENSNNSDPSQFRRGTPHKLSGTKETLSSLLSEETQEKEIIIASEAAIMRKEKTPAAGNNNFSRKKEEKKSDEAIHPCLVDVDEFTPAEKKTLTKKFAQAEPPQDLARWLAYMNRPEGPKLDSRPKAKLRYLYAIANDPESYKDALDELGYPKLTKAQQQAKEEEIKASEFRSLRDRNKNLVRNFKNGEAYDGWKCRISEDWFDLKSSKSSFSINFGDKNFEKTLDNMLKKTNLMWKK